MMTGYRISIVIFMLCLAGCGTIELREAQDSYADAVRIESEIRAGGGETLMNLSAAQLAYRDTLGKLDEVLKEKEKDLRSNRLYGSARVLRALILWRITALDFNELSDVCQKQADAAGDNPEDEYRRQWIKELRSIESGLGNNTLTLETRDRTVYRALYGLYAFDVLKRIDYDSPDANIECSIDWFNQAMTHLWEAARIPSPDHEIQKWLAMSNLTVQSDFNAKLTRTRAGNQPWLDAGYDPHAYVLKAACPAQHFWDEEKEEEQAFLGRLNSEAKGVSVVLSRDADCP